MARWPGIVGSFRAGWGAFLLLGACALAVCAMITALCASHSRKGDGDDQRNSHTKSPGRAPMNKKIPSNQKLGRSDEAADDGEGEFVWQRNILMGERCRPPYFSGVIIYDAKGNRLPQFPPRSPRLDIVFSPALQAADGKIAADVCPKA